MSGVSRFRSSDSATPSAVLPCSCATMGSGAPEGITDPWEMAVVDGMTCLGEGR